MIYLRLTSLALCFLAFLVGWIGVRAATPDSVRGILPLDPPTPYIRFTPESEARARAIVIHGLNSNKEFMQMFAMALADANIEVYVVDLPGHGDSSARFTYMDSLLAVEGLLHWLGGNADIVVGHSMGGALLTNLAPSRNFRTMLLLSPAPIPVEDFSSERLLVVTGSLEAPRVNQYVPALIDAAGPETSWWRFPYAAHSSALFEPDKIRQLVEWISGEQAQLQTRERYGWLSLMALASIAPAWIFRPKFQRAQAETSPPASLSLTLVGYVAASSAAVLMLRLMNPVGWLDIFATDYLIGLILVAGLLLWRGRSVPVTGRSLLVALASAAYVIGVLLVGVVNQWVHLVPSGIQWIWFPVLTLAGLPLFLHDSATLSPIPMAWKRWGAFLLTRLILWATAVSGVLFLSPEASFLVLIMHLVVLFWLLLWWLTALVGRLAGQPGAAALFAALVQGWVFATLSVRV